MKISAVKLFELSQIEDETTRQAVAPLVEYINQVADQLIRLSQKQTTIIDNIDAEVKDVKLTSGTEQEVVVRNTERILGCVPIKAINNSVVSFKWRITTTGNLAVTCGFSSSDKTTTSILVLYR